MHRLFDSRVGKLTLLILGMSLIFALYIKDNASRFVSVKIVGQTIEISDKREGLLSKKEIEIDFYESDQKKGSIRVETLPGETVVVDLNEYHISLAGGTTCMIYDITNTTQCLWYLCIILCLAAVMVIEHKGRQGV